MHNLREGTNLRNNAQWVVFAASRILPKSSWLVNCRIVCLFRAVLLPLLFIVLCRVLSLMLTIQGHPLCLLFCGQEQQHQVHDSFIFRSNREYVLSLFDLKWKVTYKDEDQWVTVSNFECYRIDNLAMIEIVSWCVLFDTQTHFQLIENLSVQVSSFQTNKKYSR